MFYNIFLSSAYMNCSKWIILQAGEMEEMPLNFAFKKTYTGLKSWGMHSRSQAKISSPGQDVHNKISGWKRLIWK